MGQAAAVQRSSGRGRKIGDAEIEALSKAFGVWSVPELRRLLDVFAGMTGGKNVCTKAAFDANFSCLYGLDVSVRLRCFEAFDMNRDGVLDFEEFVRGLTLCQRGRPEENIRFLFSLYSSDGSSLSFEDVVRLLWDANGNCATAGAWSELRRTEAKQPAATRRVVVYLNEDADLQHSAMQVCRAKAKALFSGPSAPAPSKPKLKLTHTKSIAEDSSESEFDDYDGSNHEGETTESKGDDDSPRPHNTVVPRLALGSLPLPDTTNPLPTPSITEFSVSFIEFSGWCVGGLFEYRAMLRRFNATPSRADEGGDFLDILTSPHGGAKGMRDGSVWCLVSSRWWQSWLEYTGRGDDINAALRSLQSAAVGGQHPLQPDRGDTPTTPGVSTPTPMVALSPTLGAMATHRTPGNRRVSHQVSALTKFAHVLPEVGKALVEGSVFAGAEAVAGNGKRASRVAVPGGSSTGRRSTVTNTPTQSRASPLTVVSAHSIGSPTLSPIESAGVDALRKPGPMEPPPALGSVRETPSRRALLGRMVSFSQSKARPGPIDNTDLQDDSAPDLVRNDAVEQDDYVLLPDAAWTQLMCWYGGGPSFPRYVVDLGATSNVFGMESSCQLEVDVWPVPLSVAFVGGGSGPAASSSASQAAVPQALFDVRVGPQKSWAELFASLNGVKEHIRTSGSSPALWPYGVPIAQQALMAIRSCCESDLRFHVQSEVHGEVLHYRLDTRDVLDTVENSFLVGGETVVVESPVHDDDGVKWALASIKGPQLWTEVEVGDYLDADVSLGMPAWKGVVVLQRRDINTYQVSPLDAPTAAYDIALEKLAPFRTRSRLTRPNKRKTVHISNPASLEALSKKLALLPSVSELPSTPPRQRLVAEEAPEDGPGSGQRTMSPRRRRTYRADVAFRRQSVLSSTSFVAGCRGLKNLGNTCFMATIIQCLNSVSSFSQYFLGKEFERDINTTNPLGQGGKLASEYGRLLQELWHSRDGVVNPLRFKVALQKFAPQFSGHNQHDCQELLAYLLDGLHEDLNLVTKKPYVENAQSNGRSDDVVAREAWQKHLLRNQSVVVDLFQGQLRSTVTCGNPKCAFTSVTFDPFMSLSLPVPADAFQTVQVTFAGMLSGRPMNESVDSIDDREATTHEPQVLRLRLPRHSKVAQVLEAVSAKTGVPADCLITSDVYKHKIYKTIADSKSLSHIRDNDTIMVHEVDPDAPALVELTQAYRKYPPGSAASALSRTGGRVSCNTPFVLSCGHGCTNLDIHASVRAQLWHWVAPLLESEEGVDDERLPYQLLVVNSQQGGCGLCSKGQQCTV